MITYMLSAQYSAESPVPCHRFVAESSAVCKSNPILTRARLLYVVGSFPPEGLSYLSLRMLVALDDLYDNLVLALEVGCQVFLNSGMNSKHC